MAGSGMKWRVNQAVRACRLMPAPARLIMLTLSDRADAHTAEIPAAHTPSLAELAAETGHGESTVKRHLGALERYGWVTRARPTIEERARHKATGYRLTVGSDGTDGPEGPLWAIEKSGSRAHSGPSNPKPRAHSGPSEGPERAIARAQSEPRTPIYDRNDQLHDQNRAATSAAPAPEPRPEKPSKHAVADALAARFWEIHRTATAQPFLAIRGCIRTAIANGLERDDVARALDRLAREHRAISGGTITTALGQLRASPSAQTTARRQSNDAGLAAAMQRAMAAEAAEAAQATPLPRKELTA